MIFTEPGTFFEVETEAVVGGGGAWHRDSMRQVPSAPGRWHLTEIPWSGESRDARVCWDHEASECNGPSSSMTVALRATLSSSARGMNGEGAMA